MSIFVFSHGLEERKGLCKNWRRHANKLQPAALEPSQFHLKGWLVFENVFLQTVMLPFTWTNLLSLERLMWSIHSIKLVSTDNGNLAIQELTIILMSFRIRFKMQTISSHVPIVTCHIPKIIYCDIIQIIWFPASVVFDIEYE